MRFASRFKTWLLIVPLPIGSTLACGPVDSHRTVTLTEAKEHSRGRATGGDPLADITMVTAENCKAVCDEVIGSSSTLQDCHPEDDGKSADCHLSTAAAGRAPATLASNGRTGSSNELGAYLAEAAHLEAASIYAFVQLAGELEAHGAPTPLVEGARRAALDEVRHARAMTALARREGVAPRSPRVLPPDVRPLVAIAAENAAEGCVRETWGALLATFQASRATDAELAAALSTIARDETSHAELAWAIDDWLRPQLSIDERHEVDRARHAAVDRLRCSLDVELHQCWARAAGLPSPDDARALLDAMASELWPRAA